MSITTYDELKSTIADWLKRSDIVADTPVFISLAEARFNRLLKTMEMETRSQSIIDTEYIPLPADFHSIREIHLEQTPDKPLEYMSPQHMRGTIAASDTGTPSIYTIVDGQIQFAPIPTGFFTVEIIYYQKIPALSASNASNWLLDTHPDLYLYASLCQAESWLMNDARIPMWKSFVNDTLAEIMLFDGKKKIGSTPLIPRTGIVV